MTTVAYTPHTLSKDYLDQSLKEYDDPEVQAFWEASAAYMENHNLTNEAEQLLKPKQALHAWSPRLIKLSYLSNLRSVGKIAGFANSTTQILGAGGIGAGLLLGERLNNTLRNWEWQYHTWTDTPEKIASYPIRQVQRQLRRLGTVTIGAALKPLGYATNLIEDIDVPVYQFWTPDNKVIQRKTAFKPTHAWRNFAADSFNATSKYFSKNNKIHLSYGFNETAKKIKKGRHKSNPISLIFVSLIGSALGTTLISWLESKVFGSYIAKVLMGGVLPAAKALFSIPTLTGGVLGYKYGKNLPDIHIPFTPFSLPLGSAIGGSLGWTYQTYLNLAKNTQVIRKNMLLSPSETGAQIRSEIMWKGSDFLNPNSADVLDLLDNHSYEIPGSSYYGMPETTELVVQNTRYLPRDGLLGRLIGKPAQFLFKHPLGRLMRIPFRGLLINTLLNLPMGLGPDTLLGNAFLAGDYLLQVLDGFPVGKTLSRGAIWGGIAGAEIAYLTGLPLATGAGIGALTGTMLTGLNLLSDLRSATVISPLQTVGPYSGVFVGPDGPMLTDLAIPGQRFPIWNTLNPTNALKTRFPFLNRRLFSRLMGFLEKNPRLLQSFRHLHYLKSSAIGALIGIQLSLFFGLPLQVTIPAGITIGVGSQYAWNRWLAPLMPKLSTNIHRMFRFIGTKIIAPIGGFFSGLDIGNAITNFIQHGITSQTALQLGLGLAGAAATIAIFGTSNPIGWAIVGVGLVLEIGFQIFTGTSFLRWIWGKISPFFQGLASAAGQILSSLFSGFIGFVGAIFARSPQEMIQYAVMGAVSFAAAGSIILNYLAASGFFSGVSVEARRLATGLLHFKANKEFSRTITNPSGQITGAIYRVSYTYHAPVYDLNGTDELPATNVKIVDQFLLPSDLTPADFIPPPSFNSDLQTTISSLPSLTPGDTHELDITINFSQPLDQLLSQHHATAICNQVTFKASLDNAPDPRVPSNIICLNDQGQSTSLPPELIAINLSKLIQECYNQYCDSVVSAKDFDPRCSNYEKLNACLATTNSLYQISPAALQALKKSATDPSGNGYLTSIGFITAVETQQGHQFDYNSGCTPQYESISATSGQLGDIIISSNSAWGIGPIGIITGISSPSGDIVYNYIGLSPTTPGLVISSTINISAVSRILHYNPGFSCP